MSLADDLRRGACAQECLCDEAAAQLDAMTECVEALKGIVTNDRYFCASERNAAFEAARSALAKLEKANG